MQENRIRISDRVYLNAHANELIFLTRSGENKVHIAPEAVQLIQRLATGIVVSPGELMQSLEKANFSKDKKTLSNHIEKLRKVFRKNGWKHAIEIIPNRGYRLKTSSDKLRKPFPTKLAILIAAAVLIFILTQLSFPEMNQELQHGMTHR